ncbi:MAG: DUF4402 domain-containing protein, partial [Candidatus Saccharimonadales bacterium]
MKKTIMMMAALVAFGCAGNAFAQHSAVANASVTLVAPIKIVQVTDLNFGGIEAPSSGTAAVDMLNDGSVNYGTAYAYGATAPTSASFDVTSQAGYDYTLLITEDDGPAAGPVGTANTVTDGSHTMALTLNTPTNTDGTDATQTDPSIAGGTNYVGAGSATITVGGDLSVDHTQPAGT